MPIRIMDPIMDQTSFPVLANFVYWVGISSSFSQYNETWIYNLGYNELFSVIKMFKSCFEICSVMTPISEDRNFSHRLLSPACNTSSDRYDLHSISVNQFRPLESVCSQLCIFKLIPFQLSVLNQYDIPISMYRMALSLNHRENGGKEPLWNRDSSDERRYVRASYYNTEFLVIRILCASLQCAQLILGNWR